MDYVSMIDSIIMQSSFELLEKAEVIVAFVSALVGFLSGWFGKKKQVGNRS